MSQSRRRRRPGAVLGHLLTMQYADITPDLRHHGVPERGRVARAVTAWTRRTRRGRARRLAQTRRVDLRPSFTAVIAVEHTPIRRPPKLPVESSRFRCFAVTEWRADAWTIVSQGLKDNDGTANHMHCQFRIEWSESFLLTWPVCPCADFRGYHI